MGYIKCPERHCNEIAEVRKAGGKRSSLYTHCPSCGTNQGNGEARQTYLFKNLKASRDELEKALKSDTDKIDAIPSKNQASSELEQADIIPEDIPTPKPKGKPTPPPTVLAIVAIFIAIFSAFFSGFLLPIPLMITQGFAEQRIAK